MLLGQNKRTGFLINWGKSDWGTKKRADEPGTKRSLPAEEWRADDICMMVLPSKI